MQETFTFRMPDLGEGTNGAFIVEVLVAVGDSVLVDDPVLEVETEKARISLPSPATGRVAHVAVSEGARASIGDSLIVVSEVTETTHREPFSEARLGSEVAGRRPDGNHSPGAAKLAKKLGVRIGDVTGSGLGGAVQSSDVIRHLRNR